MDLSVIYDSIVPDNIKELPVVKASLNIFIELLNRNSQIAQRINRIYNIDNELWYKLDSDGEPITVSDSTFLKTTKDNLKKGLLLTYLSVLYNCIGEAQTSNLIRQATKLRNYNNSFINKEQINILSSEFLGSFRNVQQSIGTENAFDYMYQFAKYLETGYLVDDLNTSAKAPSNFISNYDGSLHKYYFTDFLHSLAHPIGWVYNYNTILNFILEDYFGIDIQYHLTRIVVKNSNNKYIFFTNLNKEQFLQSLRIAVQSDETRSNTIWMESPLYYDQNETNSRSITYKMIENFNFLELDDLDTDKITDYFNEYDVLLVHFTYQCYNRYSLDGTDRASLITFTNGKILYFDNLNVYYGDLNNSYDGLPYTEPLYKFDGFFDLDCGSISEIEKNATYTFLYTDDVEFLIDYELTYCDNYYLEPCKNNQFRLYGSPLVYTQGYDESKHNLKTNGNLRTFDSNFDLSFTFKNKTRSYINITTDFGQQFIQTYDNVGVNVVKFSTSNFGGEYLTIKALNTDSGVYLKTNILNKFNNATKIVNWDYDDLAKHVYIQGTTTKSNLNLICNNVNYVCSITGNNFSVDFDLNELAIITVDNLYIETNLFIKDFNNIELQYPNFVSYTIPTAVTVRKILNPDFIQDGVNADYNGKLNIIDDTLQSQMIEGSETYALTPRSLYQLTETNEYVLGVEEDLDNYTDSNFKNNLVYIYKGYKRTKTDTSEVYVVDSTKYVQDDIMFDFGADNFLLFNTEFDGDTYKNYEDMMSHGNSGTVDYNVNHNFLYTIEDKTDEETTDQASSQRINFIIVCDNDTF